ncbi:MAG: deoxyribonuclease IV [Candidatus Latescibacterota bacterium]
MPLGAHQSIAGGLHTALERGRRATCDVVQIFNKASNQWAARPLAAAQIDRFRAAMDATGIPVVCSHTGYLINLASPDPALRLRSLESLSLEMQRCQDLGIPALVLHPGSHVDTGEEAGLERVARAIDEVCARLPDNPVVLCLETASGQGSHLGYRFEQLAAIIAQVAEHERLGVCLDTCHVFSAGYGLATRAAYRATWAEFDRLIGRDRLRVIHLNDSKGPRGARKDRHEHIGQGEIGLEAFRLLVNDPARRRIPMVLETPKQGDGLEEDLENLATLRSLVRARRQSRRSPLPRRPA